MYQGPSGWHTFLLCIKCTTQLGAVHILTEGTLSPTVYVTDKHIKEYWSQDANLGDTTHYQFHLDISLCELQYARSIILIKLFYLPQCKAILCYSVGKYSRNLSWLRKLLVIKGVTGH